MAQAVTDAYATVSILRAPENATLTYSREGAQLPIRTMAVRPDDSEIILGFLEGHRKYVVSLQVGNQTLAATSFTTPPANQSWADPRQALVRPGAPYDPSPGFDDGIDATPEGGSGTGGWILRDATNTTLYQLIDMDGLRGRPMYVNHTQVGEVVAVEDENTAYGPVRWKLVRLNESIRARVTPSANHWGGPTGILMPGVAAQGDTVCYYGWGQESYAREETRHRCGQLHGFGNVYNETATVNFYASGWVSPPDQGAPYMAYDSGQAVGTLRAVFTFQLSAGHTLCFTLQRLQERGYDLALAKAPYTPPPADPGPPAAPLPGSFQEPYFCSPETLGPSQPG